MKVCSEVWDIPELLLLILERLKRKDCVAMTLVCRKFWRTTIPIIWRSISGSRQATHLWNLLPPALKSQLVSQKHITPEVGYFELRRGTDCR